MVKYLTRGLKILVALVVVGLLGVITWLHGDVRSLEWARPRIESALNPAGAPYKVSYSEANLDWRDWSKVGLLEIKDVSVTTQDGETKFANFPAIYVSFSPFGIITHGRAIQTVVLEHPKLLLTRDENHALRLGLNSDSNALPLNDFLAFFGPASTGSDEQPNEGMNINLKSGLPFRTLIIRNADLTFTDAITHTTIVSDRANFRLARRSGNISGSIALPFTYNDVPGNFQANLRSNALSDAHTLNATLGRVPAQFACILVSCEEGLEVQGLLSGKLAIGLDDDAQPTAADINLTAEKAKFSDPRLFPEPLSINHALVQLRASNALHNVQLNRLSIGLEDIGFEITGTAHRDAKGWYMDGEARGTRAMALQKLYKYWPLPLAPDSRAWVTSSMKAGHGDQLYLKAHLTPPDWEQEFLPDSAIAASVQAQDITAEYLVGFPLMHHINGTVTFTGETVRIEANSGSLLTGTQVSRASVFFPNLNQPGTPVETNITLHAPANDAATLLALKYFPFAKPLQLNPETIKGAVDATLGLKFDAFSNETAGADAKKDEIDFSHVIYNIATNLRDIAQPKFLGKFNVSAVNGTLNANNDGFKLASNVKLNEVMPFTVNAEQKSGGDVNLDVRGNLGRGLFTQLGLPENDRIGEGSAKVSTKLVAKKDAVFVREANIDLTDLALDIPELTWSKKRGVPGNIALTSNGSEYRLNMKADDLVIADARATVAADGTLQSINAPSIKSARNDFAASYATRPDGFNVSLTGKKLDSSASYAKSDNGLLGHFPPINLSVDLGELVLVAPDAFTAVKGTLQCNPRTCEYANLHANMGKTAVNAVITRRGGVRQLQVNANDTGELLRGLNFTDRMFGGTLDLRGTYDDKKTPPVFNGRVLVNEFKVKNSAILARIFSIGSLTGLSNLLTGNGIAFDKLTMQITHQGGVLGVKEGKAHGNAIGITTAGTVDTNNSELRLKGVVVPAYALNSLIGRIPIIGAIAGGDGEGLIAFNYSVQGLYSDPKVSVNPLSGLTPGFLRGIFDIFDSEPKKPKTEEKPAAALPEEGAKTEE